MLPLGAFWIGVHPRSFSFFCYTLFVNTVIYYNPQQNIERGEQPLHSFLLLGGDGNVLGQFEVRHVSDPVEQFVVVAFSCGAAKDCSMVFGSLFKAFEDFLRERKKTGVISRQLIPPGFDGQSAFIFFISP